MEALIVVAHGSKVESSNNEIKKIVNNIKENLKDEQLNVFYAFLELAEPSIFVSINKAITHGSKVIKIFPYFLAAGKHVKEDIPAEIKKFKKRYPEIEFILLPHIGECKGIENLILSNI
jgi:sirohydrochlorin cobaltochelatase